VLPSGSLKVTNDPQRPNVNVTRLHAVRDHLSPRRLDVGHDDLHAFL
jgi:hypothetical protein